MPHRRPLGRRRPGRSLFLLVALPALVALLTLASGGAAFAQASAAGPVPSGLYKLTTASGFVEGCFAPCMCPVQWNQRLLGTVRLTDGAAQPGYRVFDVTDVNWLVKGFEYWVTGSGTYRIGGAPVMHQLTLDLKVGDRDVVHYDSGLVPAVVSNDGTITISINMNNLVCHDTVFNVTMRPLMPTEVVNYGLRNSLYQEGCFGLCECAIRSWPFTGRFGLTRLDANMSAIAVNTPADFGVVDLRGSVLDPDSAAPTGSPVTGGGLLHVDASTSMQRLRVELLENGAGPTRFDSGDVHWNGNLKRIDAAVAADGFACYDRVYAIHAVRRPRSDMATQAIRTDPARPGVIPAP